MRLPILYTQTELGNAKLQRKAHRKNTGASVGAVIMLFLALALWSPAPTYGASAGTTVTLTNFNSDLVTVQLNGAGTMSVSLVNTNQGPIDQIILQNTDGTSMLTINVKKSATGNGRISINSISGNGSLKGLSAKSADLVGSGINLRGFIGTLTIGNLTSSAITLGGDGVATNALTLGSFTAGVIDNSSIVVTGNVKKVTLGQMIDSELFAGFTPSSSSDPMGGGGFGNGYKIQSVSVNGLKGSTNTAFANSIIAAESIGTVEIASVNTNNNGVAFGILTGTSAIKSVSVKQPKFSWKPKWNSLKQTLNDFQVRRIAIIVVSPNTRVLKAADLSGAVISTNSLIVATKAPSLQGVQPGDILVSGIGKGLLAKVVSVTPQGNTILLQTAPASLTNAFQTLAFDQTIPFQPGQVGYLAPGVSIFTNTVAESSVRRMSSSGPSPQEVLAPLNLVSFPLNNVQLVDTDNLTITLNGLVNLTVTPSMSIQFDYISFIPTGLQSFSASVDVDVTSYADLSVSAGVSTNAEILLATVPGVPITVGPVLVTPTLYVYGGVTADVEANLECDASLDANYTAGAAWQQGVGWTNISSSSIHYSTSLTNSANIGGSVRGYVRAEIEFSIYDVGGPDIYAEGGITLAANLNLSPPPEQVCWSLKGDLDAGVGVALDPFGLSLLSYEDQLFNITDPIAGTCYPLTADVAVQALPSTKGTVSGEGWYPIGSQQVISATPNSGDLFTDWSDGNTQNPRTITVPATNITYTANFVVKTLPTATITVQASPSNGGTVSGSGTYPVGTNVQISATASNGWKFTGWNDGGAQTHTITVLSGGTTYTATFSPITYTITATAGANG